MQDSVDHRVLRGLYSLVIRLALPISLYYLIWRGLRQREYFDRWSERFALYRGERVNGCLWIHAVSVGEVNAAAPLLEALRERHPGQTLLVTTTTPTGSARVRALWGDTVRHVYLPYDLPGAVRNFLDHFQPRLAVVMETEIWPNLFAELERREHPRDHRQRAAVGTFAARLSADHAADPSGPGHGAIAWPRSRRPMPRATASSARARRGCRSAAISSTTCRCRRASSSRRAPGVEDWGDRPVWIAASTHPDEEEVGDRGASRRPRRDAERAAAVGAATSGTIRRRGGGLRTGRLPGRARAAGTACRRRRPRSS